MQMGVYIMELTEKKEFDLLSLGEIMLRLSPPDNERITRGDSFSKQAGGAELNAITGAAMLGLRCGIISKLPANDLGVYIKNRVRLCGVSDDYLVYDDDKDARLGVYYYENGAYPRKPRIVYDRKNTSINKLTVDDCFDVIYVSMGKEQLLNQALSSYKEECPKRLVIVENVAQMSLLSIPGTVGYCTVSATGQVTYYKFKE